MQTIELAIYLMAMFLFGYGAGRLRVAKAYKRPWPEGPWGLGRRIDIDFGDEEDLERIRQRTYQGPLPPPVRPKQRAAPRPDRTVVSFDSPNFVPESLKARIESGDYERKPRKKT